jgi:hypothetical protein
VRRAYSEAGLAAECRTKIEGQPCPGLTHDAGAAPEACDGSLAYVKYVIRGRVDGSPIALALGSCPKCRAVGSAEVELPKPAGS